MTATDPDLERRLVEAFRDARRTVDANTDLFARVERSLDEARRRRQFRLRLGAGIGAFVVATAGLTLALSDHDNGRIAMRWWVIELVTNIVLVALAVGLGPFIKRFGRAYAADVFRANPRTGKSYLVLTDVAYYLIFTSFVLFTIRFVAPAGWRVSTGAQLKDEVGRVAGILLLMGVLHAVNVVALPVIGGLLANAAPHDDRDAGPSSTYVAGPPLGPGTWVVRIEPSAGAERTDGTS